MRCAHRTRFPTHARVQRSTWQWHTSTSSPCKCQQRDLQVTTWHGREILRSKCPFCTRPTHTVFALISQGRIKEKIENINLYIYIFYPSWKFHFWNLFLPLTSRPDEQYLPAAGCALRVLCPCTTPAEDTWDRGQSLAGQSWRVMPSHGVPTESICFACLCSKYSRAHWPSPAREQVFLPGAAALCSTNTHLPDIC